MPFSGHDVAKLDYHVESGEIIGHVGLIHPTRYTKLEYGERHGIHFEIFSQDNIVAPSDMPEWKLINDDTDDDVLCEIGDLVKKVKDTSFLFRLGWDQSRFATLSDAESFYRSLSDTDRKVLRSMVTYNTSFWSIDWKKMRLSNPEWARQFDFGDEDENLAKEYMWWSECEAKEVALPPRTSGKALVYHYHPIALLEYLAARMPPVPIFFVKRNGGKEYVVARPADINIPAKETVWVYDPPLADWVLGKGSTLQGCNGIENGGQTDLYEALMDPATAPGIPALGTSAKNIWASIYQSEGALEAINSYDRAFFSFGPIQQTVGADNDKGELQGALNAVKFQAPAVYEKYFGRHKFDVVQIAKDLKVDKGYVAIGGNLLKTSSDKAVLRDFIWAYHSTKAMADVQFRLPFLAHGFERLDVVKGLTAKVGGVTVTLGDIYKTEAALALILDAHINLPAKVDSNNGIWVRAAKTVLGITGQQTIDTSAITQANEYAMIAELRTLREASGMWSPALRAAFILLCAKGLDNALATKFGYASLNQMIQDSTLSATQANKRMFSFLGHKR